MTKKDSALALNGKPDYTIAIPCLGGIFMKEAKLRITEPEDAAGLLDIYKPLCAAHGDYL